MTRSKAIPADKDLTRLTKNDIQLLGIDPSLLPDGYALIVRKDSNGNILPGDLELARSLLELSHVVLQFCNAIPGVASSELRSRFFGLQSTHALCPELWSRDALSSGYYTARTADILCKDEYFKLLVESIRKREARMVPLSLWSIINLEGSHKFHHDKFKRGANYRNLISFFGGRKRMWFLCKKTGRMFGVEVPHNAHVTLDKIGGGLIGDVDHCVELAANTILFAFDSV